MAKKVFVSAAVLAVSCITAWGQTGYNVTYTNENDQYSHQNMATITKSENGNMTLVDAISKVNAKKINNAAIKKVKIVGDITSDASALSAITCTTIDLSEATFTSFTNDNVKYVVLPNEWTKEQVNTTAKTIGKSLESAASALGNYTYSDGFEYIDPYTKEKVQVEKGKIQTKDNDTYGLLTGTFSVAPTKEESTYTYVDNGETTTYNGTLLFDKAGDAFGVKEGTTLVPLFPDTYLADNANNKYTGTITRQEEGAIYGNTGEEFDVDSSLDGYQYSSNGKNYVYFGDDTYTNGEKLYSPIPNDNIVKLKKIEEYHAYNTDGVVVNIDDYTNVSERQWDDNKKVYYVIGKNQWNNDIWLYIVDAYTYGESNTKYDTTNNPVYTKGEEYYGYTFSENPFKELTELTEKTYYNVQTKEIYTGKVYDGEKGGTGEDVALTYVTDYYKDESQTQKYDGPVTTDNKGVEDAKNYFALTSAYVYTYKDLAGNEHTKESTVRMTEIQLTGDELYIAISPVKIQSELPTSVSLTAYVKKPGTLVYSILNMSQLESKYYDWYGNGIWYVDQTNNNYKYDYTAKNVKKITLSGNLNAIDLNNGQYIISEEGHLVSSNGKHYNALPNCTPDTLDLSDAIFGEGADYHPEDMTISKLFPTLKSVLLPTHESQTVIPADCFNNMYLTELMIPSHYEVICERAFSTSHTLSHIYVKDIKTGTIYDHGDYTITLPESLKEIKSEGVESFDKATFSGNALEKITDVYVMAKNAPKCGKYAFNAAITYGNNGFAGNWAHPIKRSNYINNEKVIAVLHYPTISRYNGEDKNYTDITRVYTLQDETGMVDGNGKLKVWPRHAEFVRSFKQAKEGHIWTDWKIYANEGDTEVIIDNSNGQYTVENPTGYNQEDYQGWHEFVLSETYITKPYDPQEHYEKFNQYDWYTICIPYNITKSMLLQAFGVNTDPKYNNKVKLFDGNGEYIDAASVEGAGADGWIYPDVRSLIQVKRSYKNLKVTLCLSEKLFTPEHCQEITIGTDGQGYEYTNLTDEDPIIIKAGMPYLIRPYVPVDTNIKNIGAYLCAYVSQLKKVEPKLFKVIEDSPKSYAVPQEKGVETQALKVDESTESNRVYVIKDDGTPCKYNFVGTYVDRFIPQYGYYLGKEKGTGKHKFFRTTKTTTKWNRYSSIITGMSTPNYVNNGAENAKDIKNIELQFDGITDDLVILKDEQPKNNNAGAKKLGIAFDDTGSDFLPTSIDEIDVEIALPEDNRIYTVNGTRVAADRLQKGIYIKDGKKIVVK